MVGKVGDVLAVLKPLSIWGSHYACRSGKEAQAFPTWEMGFYSITFQVLRKSKRQPNLGWPRCSMPCICPPGMGDGLTRLPA